MRMKPKCFCTHACLCTNMAVSTDWGVLSRRCPYNKSPLYVLFGVYIRALDFRKRPYICACTAKPWTHTHAHTRTHKNTGTGTGTRTRARICARTRTTAHARTCTLAHAHTRTRPHTITHTPRATLPHAHTPPHPHTNAPTDPHTAHANKQTHTPSSITFVGCFCCCLTGSSQIPSSDVDFLNHHFVCSSFCVVVCIKCAPVSSHEDALQIIALRLICNNASNA